MDIAQDSLVSFSSQELLILHTSHQDFTVCKNFSDTSLAISKHEDTFYYTDKLKKLLAQFWF